MSLKRDLAVLLLSALVPAGAHASGFEKSVMWSGKYAGIGGAAVGGVTGSQSIFFNPAGLAADGDVSLNFSPTLLHLTGYLANPAIQEGTDKDFIPFGDFSLSYRITEKFGLGAAAYVAGGERGVYNDVDLRNSVAGGAVAKADLKTDLALSEYAFGGGYEVLPGLRLGAAWRIVKAKGSLTSLKKSVSLPAYSYVAVTDATQTRYNGYRLGAEYEGADKDWGVGFAYRSKVSFNAQGPGSGTTIVTATNAVTVATVSPIKVGLVFPEAFSLGGHYALNRDVHFFTGVDLVKYSEDKQITMDGTLNSVPLPNIPLEWEDMWNVRFGTEYTGFTGLALRAGYVITSRVTSTRNAKATLPPPGTGHMFTLGAGTELARGLDLDGAFEYAFNHGTGSMTQPAPGDTTREILAGIETETRARSIALHTGLTYRF